MCEIKSERRAGFNPKARAMVPFRSSSIPIPLAVQGHPLAQTDRRQKQGDSPKQSTVLYKLKRVSINRLSPATKPLHVSLGHIRQCVPG